MNSTLPFFSIVVSIIAIALLIVAFVIMGATIPKIVKQSNVRNGLITLRRYLLVAHYAIFFLIGISIATLTARFYIPIEYRTYTVAILIINFSIMAIIYAITQRKIYQLQYSEESLLLHEQIAELEKRKDKK